jgi:hypothetical protein
MQVFYFSFQKRQQIKNIFRNSQTLPPFRKKKSNLKKNHILYNTFMRISTIFTILLTSLLCACSYHSQLPRGLYAPSKKPSVQKRVLVVSDKFFQEQVIFKDYHEKNAVHSYKIDVKDGVLTATAEALGEVFALVEVNPSRTALDYDIVVQVTYHVTDGRSDSTDSVQWLSYSQIPFLQTSVQLTFYTPQGDELFAGYALRKNRVELTNQAAVAQRAESAGTALLIPLTAPIYTQQLGDALKYTLSRDLTQCLHEIIDDLPVNDFQLDQNYVK